MYFANKKWLFVFQYFLLIRVDQVFSHLLFVHMADDIRMYILKMVSSSYLMYIWKNINLRRDKNGIKIIMQYSNHHYIILQSYLHSRNLSWHDWVSTVYCVFVCKHYTNTIIQVILLHEITMQNDRNCYFDDIGVQLLWYRGKWPVRNCYFDDIGV